MGVLNKDIIETWILPHLTVGSRGFEPTASVEEIINAIFYRLKTGCQWRELPTKEFFSDKILSWNSVYYHFNEWAKDGCWRKIWINILSQNLKHLDLSSIELDGSHTPAKNGGDAVGYQGRKASHTTNALFLCDNQAGPPVRCYAWYVYPSRGTAPRGRPRMIYLKFKISSMKFVIFLKLRE